ncbi:MAG: methyltransferase domain-containing protein [Puniceicoccales bacterium]|jgi:23S rRNA (uracil1939-C5)-methyltransferase/tRNA (uracil-5-)-methyltransferase|nr:methyltransferase domain-containing protein [Puniceicoccales bacterium]
MSDIATANATGTGAAAETRRAPKKFNPTPFAYHEEIEVEITTLTNLGDGLGRVNGWVVMVPFALPGERVLARVWHNAANFSRADCVRIVTAAPERVEPRCPLFGTCGGCQYQNLARDAQLAWKTRQVAELLERLAGVAGAADLVSPCFPSPRQYGYRSKITPHWEKSGFVPPPVGFLAAGSKRIIDVPRCPIATDAINAALPAAREAAVRDAAAGRRRGATLLLRDTAEGIVTDPRATAVENVAGLRLRFPAGEFFQNNPFILPAFVDCALAQAAGGDAAGDGKNNAAGAPCRFLLDAYCGSGLFALAAAAGGRFERALGVEISADAVRNATANAAANGLKNVRFAAGDAARIFAEADTPAAETAVLMDPPRRGSDAAFLEQLIAFAPRRIVYVSCAPDTQMRDLRPLLAAGYAIERVQPFDLFPQTRHIENIITLARRQ